MSNYVTVPLYDTLGDEALEFIINQTEMEVIIIEKRKVSSILALGQKLTTLKMLIIMDSVLDNDIALEAEKFGFAIVSLSEMEEKGSHMAEFKHSPPAASDLSTICYTSGTTGMPKGAMIQHSQQVAAISSALFFLGINPKKHNPTPAANLEVGEEVYLSFLPLAHILERVVFATILTIGGKIGFYQGDIQKLLSDVEALKPTLFVAVPRLFNRIHDKIVAGVEAKGGIAKWLFNHALDVKLNYYRKSGSLNHWLWDRLVFGAVRAKLGGRVKVMVTGAAPLSPPIMDFLRVVFSCNINEGYGMTESCALTAVTVNGDLAHGQVGGPAPGVEMKLVDIPEMGYSSKDIPNPRGELYLRGPTIFSGYYKNEEQTKENLADGWLKTGDVGMFDEQGRLFIIDRKKALFKLAQGEYISPERIESVICRIPCISQAYIEGHSLRSFVVAIIIPDEEMIMGWAKDNDVSGSFADVCKDIRTRIYILAEIARLGNAGTKELKGFEVPKVIYLDSELFSVENGLLTPTFKMKRAQLKQKYDSVVASLYDSIKE